ncbi:MAG: SPOR domain-containing protein [Aureispira sp.]
MDLAAYIEELLYENDCVILPTIGGFIVNLTTAEIDFVEHQLCPPNKTVSFNPKLVNNDGLLVHHVSQKQHISYKQAQTDIETYARQIERELFDNKIVAFNNIGKLYFNSDSKLEFVPEHTNFLRSSYGLPVVSCTPILRSKEYLKPSQAQAAPIRRLKRKKAVWLTPARIAVVAAALLLFFATPRIWKAFSQPQTPIVAQEISTPAEPARQNKVVSASILPTTANTTAETKEVVAEDNTAQETAVAEPVETGATEDYVIVLGAFGKEKNAYRLANKLAKDNYLPDVTVKNGLNRVGVQLNCSPQELQTHLQFLQDNYNPKAWILE